MTIYIQVPSQYIILSPSVHEYNHSCELYNETGQSSDWIKWLHRVEGRLNDLNLEKAQNLIWYASKFLTVRMPFQGLTKNVPKYFNYIVSVHTLTITFELIKAGYTTVGSSAKISDWSSPLTYPYLKSDCSPCTVLRNHEWFENGNHLVWRDLKVPQSPYHRHI